MLLMAKESNDDNDILMSVKQIINNCIVDDLNIEKLCIFDLEYLFIKIRALSVDNVVKLVYKDLEDEQNYTFDIDLNKINVVYSDKKVSNTIKISDKIGIVMRYPSASLYSDKEFLNLEKDYMFELIKRCIDKIYYGDEVFEPKDSSNEEMDEFLDGLTIKTYEEINEFLSTTPSIKYVIEYKNSLGNDRKIELSTLNDFFSWR